MIRTFTPNALQLGLVAGALAVPIFHQAMVLLTRIKHRQLAKRA